MFSDVVVPLSLQDNLSLDACFKLISKLQRTKSLHTGARPSTRKATSGNDALLTDVIKDNGSAAASPAHRAKGISMDQLRTRTAALSVPSHTPQNEVHKLTKGTTQHNNNPPHMQDGSLCHQRAVQLLLQPASPARVPRHDAAPLQLLHQLVSACPKGRFHWGKINRGQLFTPHEHTQVPQLVPCWQPAHQQV